MAGALVVRILGPVRVTGAVGSLTPQQLSLVAYLACVGPARRETLVEALWAGQPISDARFANLVSDVRRAVGRRHLPAMAGNHYRLVDVTTDLDLLLALGRDAAPLGADPASRRPSTVDASGQAAGRAPDPQAELAALGSAMGLVRGPVFGTPTDRSWWWLDGHPEVVAQAEAAVGQMAHRLVSILWRCGELDRAREVCRQALSCCPLDRDLVVALEGLHRAQGRPAAAKRLITSWRVQVERLTGEDPGPLPSAPAVGRAAG